MFEKTAGDPFDEKEPWNHALAGFIVTSFDPHRVSDNKGKCRSWGSSASSDKG